MTMLMLCTRNNKIELTKSLLSCVFGTSHRNQENQRTETLGIV